MIDKLLNLIYTNIMAFYGKLIYKKYMKMSKKANKKSEKILLKRIRKNQNTEFGKKYNFKEIKTIEDYQNKVPLTTYNDFKDYVEETIKTGKQKLLIKEKIKYFVHTSGTTGVKKMIPVIKASYIPYIKSAAIYFWNMKLEVKKRLKIFRGRGLSTVETESEKLNHGIKTGYISGYAMSSAKAILPLTTCIPKETFDCGDGVDTTYIKARYSIQDKNLVFLMSVFMSTLTDLINYIIENKEMLINDIETGKINESVIIPQDLKKKLCKKLKPNPKRANELRTILESNDPKRIVSKIWPRMSIILAISTGEFAPFNERMREYCGNSIAFHYFMHGSSEALIATAIYSESKDYMIMPDGGFYEFIPVDDEEQILTMDQLEVGKKYEIIVTNLSGLYRYQIKDVVKVTGFIGQIPLIRFAYRKGQIVNICGVHFTIEHLEKTIVELENKIKNQILDYSIYVDNDCIPSRMVLYIELENPKRIKNINEMFDQIVSEINEEHGRMLKIGECSSTIVNILKPKTYENYRHNKDRKNANQIKTIRIIDSKEKREYFEQNILYGGDTNE